MTQRDKVKDYYWLGFIARVFSYVPDGNRYGATEKGFWMWFYTELCKGDKTIAHQKFDEAVREMDREKKK